MLGILLAASLASAKVAAVTGTEDVLAVARPVLEKAGYDIHNETKLQAALGGGLGAQLGDTSVRLPASVPPDVRQDWTDGLAGCAAREGGSRPSVTSPRALCTSALGDLVWERHLQRTNAAVALRLTYLAEKRTAMLTAFAPGDPSEVVAKRTNADRSALGSLIEDYLAGRLPSQPRQVALELPSPTSHGTSTAGSATATKPVELPAGCTPPKALRVGPAGPLGDSLSATYLASTGAAGTRDALDCTLEVGANPPNRMGLTSYSVKFDCGDRVRLQELMSSVMPEIEQFQPTLNRKLIQAVFMASCR